jgi:hypothetical protein
MCSPPLKNECEVLKKERKKAYWLLKALLLLIVPVARSGCNNLKAKISVNNFQYSASTPLKNRFSIEKISELISFRE